MMDELPLLPGPIPSDPPTRFHVSHTLTYKNGVAFPKAPLHGVGQQPLDTHSVNYLDKWDEVSTYGEPRRTPKINTVHPQFEKYENLTLAFRAFCVEPVKGLLEEYPRVRHVLFFYHLEDDTISIMEPPISNSGCVQGKILRRHRVPKDESSELFWHWKDLNVGGRLWLYGRTYQLASCDAFSREFLESHGISVGAEIEVPPDPYTQQQQTRAMQQQTEAAEEALSPTANLYQGLDKLGRFLAFDRQVLRFYAVWQDPRDPQKEKRYFKVLFYLADGTMEVRPEYKLNDGHYHYPSLLARQLLPKGNLPADLPSFRELDCYLAEDLLVGTEIQVLARRLLLYDCDGFTRDYYAARLNIVQPPTQTTESPLPPATVQPLPPHNGFGSPEDSLLSCLHLVPRRPCPSHPGPDDRPLRYLLRLDSERPLDLARRFILSFQPRLFFCTITELKGRNTGRQAGRFLGPRRVPKQEATPHPHQPEYYGPEDFSIGATIFAAGCHFVVVGADLYVYKYVSQRKGIFREELIQNLEDYVRKEGLIGDAVDQN